MHRVKRGDIARGLLLGISMSVVATVIVDPLAGVICFIMFTLFCFRGNPPDRFS